MALVQRDRIALEVVGGGAHEARQVRRLFEQQRARPLDLPGEQRRAQPAPPVRRIDATEQERA
jgi:hypothetical protein